MNGTAIVGWSGRGDVDALVSSVAGVVRGSHLRARVRASGTTVLVSGQEPAAVALMLGNLPGASWIAIGRSADSYGELGRAGAELAGRYLKRGDRFTVVADSTGTSLPTDLSGLVASNVLERVKGARVDEESPKVRFRVAFDGRSGAVGVELEKGPGGVPTGTERATCFVSGGKHSSTVAWMALLSGYRVRLIHAATSEASLREAARLYSELSHRVDCSSMSLEVLEGEGAIGAVVERMIGTEGLALGGFHPGCSSAPQELEEVLGAPLLLVQEEEVEARFLGLGLRGHSWKEAWKTRRTGKVSKRTFGGVRADVNGVLDGLE